MTSEVWGTSGARFSVGDTLQSAWEAMAKNFPLMIFLALILVGAPRVLVILMFGAPTVLDMSAVTQTSAARTGWSFTLTSLLSLFGGALLTASAAQASAIFSNGSRPSLAQCLRPAYMLFLPLIAIALLEAFGFGFALILLVFPFFILVTLWAVVIPCRVLEPLGVFAAFSRSAELTKGHRWSVLGYLVVVWLLNLIILIGLGLIVAVLKLTLGRALDLNVASSATQVGGALIGSFASLFNASSTAALYLSLRRARDGATPDSLAVVFD
jgi:hypothetical protein